MNALRYPDAEPTLYDVIEMMQGGFAQMEEYMDERFAAIDVRFDRVEGDIEVIKTDIVEMKADIVELKADIVEIKADIVVMKTDIYETKNDVRNLYRLQNKLDIQDEDRADTVMNHEERIVRLEVWKKGFGKKGMAGA